jgi:hypothetical protein
MRITKDYALERWEMIYAEAVLKLENDGLFITETISNAKGGKGLKVHPAYSVAKDATRILGDFNKWHESEVNQLALEL